MDETPTIPACLDLRFGFGVAVTSVFYLFKGRYAFACSILLYDDVLLKFNKICF